MSDVRIFVIFRLGDEECGLPIEQVREIQTKGRLSRIPGAPPHVEGVMNLRGRVITVINLPELLGIDEKGKLERVIVVEIGGHTLGYLVHEVMEILRIPEEAIEPAEKIVLGSSVSLLAGIARLGERLILLLDFERLLSVTGAL